MRNLKLEVLELFAEAQAPARDITDEKCGNLRADYLHVQSTHNAEAWTNTKANKAKLAARNARRRELYKAKRKPPVDHNVARRARYAKQREAINQARRAAYDPEARSNRHKRTGH